MKSNVLFLMVFSFFLYSCQKDDNTDYANSHGNSLKALFYVKTFDVTYIELTSAYGGGYYEPSAFVKAGICWSTHSNPTTMDNFVICANNPFSYKMSGLSAFTTYYVRAYAVNGSGTTYGNEVSFTTDLLRDYDDNVYNAIKIGDQIWMKQNLKTTHYSNGNYIPNVTNDYSWDHLTTGAYCYYDNNSDYANSYGNLYNWYAVNDIRKLCPTGWHVPSKTDWVILINYLHDKYIGGKLKEAGTSHWKSPNTGATNESGFTALPGSCRYINGAFDIIVGYYGYWWGSTDYDNGYADCLQLYYNSGGSMLGFSGKVYGFSVRCLKD